MAKQNEAASGGKKSKKTLFIILGIILALIILVMAFGGDDDSSADTAADTGAATAASADGTTAAPETTTAEKDFYVVGETYADNNCTIAFTGANENFTAYHEYSDVPAGMKVVQATFDFNNTGNSDFTADAYSFDCYADNESCESFYSVDGAGFMDTLSPGRQATGRSVYFLVPENAQSIILEYETNVWSENKVQFKIK